MYRFTSSSPISFVNSSRSATVPGSVLISAICARVLARTAAPTGCRSSWYVSNSPSGAQPLTVAASFQPRLNASCDLLGALRQPLDADQQEIAQRVGEAGAAARGPGDGEFLDEEGVAVGAFEDLVHVVGVGFPGEDAGHLTADLLAGEAAEFDAPDRSEEHT